MCALCCAGSQLIYNTVYTVDSLINSGDILLIKWNYSEDKIVFSINGDEIATGSFSLNGSKLSKWKIIVLSY